MQGHHAQVRCTKPATLGVLTVKLGLQDFWRFLSDDMALLRAARAKWTLVPSASVEAAAQV